MSCIPKIIFQTSYYKPPKYVTDIIKSRSNGWEYFYFTDLDIIKFIKENPIEGLSDSQEFDNSVDTFLSLEKGPHKADFFRYYYLYINGGVYIDSDAILEKDMDSVISENLYPNTKFFTVKSLLNNNSMFNGFIGSEPKNPLIYKALKHIVTTIQTNKEILKSDYFIFCKELTNIISKHLTFLTKNLLPPDIKIFTEKSYDKKRTVTIDKANELETIILSHYDSKSPVEPIFPIPDKKLKEVVDTKIGITFNMPDNINSLFTNGIKQNVLYFTELLLNIGYDCTLIVNNQVNLESKGIQTILYDSRFKTSSVKNVLVDDYDIVIILGFELTNQILTELKHLKTKIIGYFCGNSYIIESEKILYNQHKKINDFNYTTTQLYDEIWSIPQMVNTNKYYWETMFRTKCIEVPFVWSDKTINMFSEEKGINFYYSDSSISEKVNGINKNKIVIFEPNISIMKWCVPALLVCENAYRENRVSNTSIINKVYLTNVSDKNPDINDFSMPFLNKFVKTLDLFLDKKVFIDSRYITLEFMRNHGHIIVSHQWENPLNYLYIELAWMGWPIVHNAHLCKDIGYYYEGFNYKEGGNVLLNVIKNHDKDIDSYIERNRNIIKRYLPDNLELQEKYKELISNLFV